MQVERLRRELVEVSDQLDALRHEQKASAAEREALLRRVTSAEQEAAAARAQLFALHQAGAGVMKEPGERGPFCAQTLGCCIA